MAAAHLSRSYRIALARAQVPMAARAGLMRLAAAQPQAFARSISFAGMFRGGDKKQANQQNGFAWQKEAFGSETSNPTQEAAATQYPPRLDFDRWVEGPVNYRPGLLSVVFLFFVFVWATRTAGMWEHTVMHPHRHYTGPNIYNERCEVVGRREAGHHH